MSSVHRELFAGGWGYLLDGSDSFTVVCVYMAKPYISGVRADRVVDGPVFVEMWVELI